MSQEESPSEGTTQDKSALIAARRKALEESSKQSPVELMKKTFNMVPFQDTMWQKSPPMMPIPGSLPPTPITVIFANGMGDLINVPLDCNAEHLKSVIADKLKLVRRDIFTLCQVGLDPSTNTVIEGWLEMNKRLSEQTPPISQQSRLLFKMRFVKIVPNIQTDPVALQLMYYQIKADILSGKCPCPSYVAVRLAALQFWIQFGIYNPSIHKVGFFEDKKIKPTDFIPEKNIENNLALLESRIFTVMSRWSPKSTLEAIQWYIQHAQRLVAFGLTSYSAKTTGDKEVHLGVVDDGLLVTVGSASEAAYFDFPRIGKWEFVEGGVMVPCNESPFTFIMPKYQAMQFFEQLAVYQLYYCISKLKMVPNPVCDTVIVLSCIRYTLM